MQTTTLTTERKCRAEMEWSRLAGEPIQFEQIGGAYFAFGSELAVLRLKNKMPAGRVAFSPNYDSWVFSLEKKF